jgi:tetratricopeptide (TPR) repeat protein
VGCLHAATPQQLRSEIELLAIGLRRRLAQDLESLNFTVRLLSDEALCRSLSSDISADAAASASGELNIDDGSVKLRPVVKIFDHDDRGSPVLAIFLAETTRPISSAIRLLGDYTRPVRSFLLAVTKDGLFPKLGRAVLFENSEELLRFWTSALEDKNIEQAALAAYRSLSQSPESSAANYVLGNVFARKDRKELALEHFLKAKERESGLPPEERARLNEAIGLAYAEIQNHQEAAKYFASAKASYETLQKGDDVRRAKRQLAALQFLLGNKTEAFEELKSQKDLETDGPSLLLLGHFAAISDQYQEAETWLSAVLKIDPNNVEAKRLLAEMHGIAGRREFAANNFADARRYLAVSLANREDVYLRYLSGLAAYRLNDYEQAMVEFAKIIDLPAEKTPLRWVEGSWLTLLECYLLTKNYDSVESSGQRAINVIGGRTESRVIVTYLRFVAKILGESSLSVKELTTDPGFQELQRNAIQGATAKKLDWDNNKVDAFIKEAKLEPEKRRLLAEVRKVLP